MTEARTFRATIGATQPRWTPARTNPYTGQLCHTGNAHLFVEIPGQRDWTTRALWVHDALDLCAACPARAQCRADHIAEGVSADHDHVRGGVFWVDGKPTRPPGVQPDPPEFTREDMLLGHAAHERGDRSPDVVAREQAYQRDRHHRRRQGRTA